MVNSKREILTTLCLRPPVPNTENSVQIPLWRPKANASRTEKNKKDLRFPQPEGKARTEDKETFSNNKNNLSIPLLEPVATPPVSSWQCYDEETGKVHLRQVAWVLPYMWAAKLPHYAPLWFKSVAATAPFLQVYLFYENPGMVFPKLLVPQYAFSLCSLVA